MMQELATLKRGLDAGTVTNAQWQSGRDAAIARCGAAMFGSVSRARISPTSLSHARAGRENPTAWEDPRPQRYDRIARGKKIRK